MSRFSNAVILPELGSAPSTPSSGGLALYGKTADSKLYYKNDGGTEYGPIEPIPTNLVTTDTTQTITGVKTFNVSGQGFFANAGTLSVNFGRTVGTTELLVGIGSAANNFFQGTATGDTSFRAVGSIHIGRGTGTAVAQLVVNTSTIVSNVNLMEGANRVYSAGNLVPVAGISATGTASSSTYLRGDGTWATVSGSAPANMVTTDTVQSITGQKTFTTTVYQNSFPLVVSGNATQTKVSVAPTATPPASPAVDDIWIVSDDTTISGTVTNYVGEIDHAERTVQFDIQAIGTTYTDIEGWQITVPATTQPYKLYLEGLIGSTTGTAAAGANLAAYLKVIDVANSNLYMYSIAPFSQIVAGASITQQFNVVATRRISPHSTPRTYKVQARTSAAIPTGWSALLLVNNDAPTQGIYPPAILRAEYV